MKRILNSLILALFSLSVLAQVPDKEPERWYEVEIILFEQLDPVSTGTEQWPLVVDQPDLNNAIDLLRTPPVAEELAPIEELQQDLTTIAIDPPETIGLDNIVTEHTETKDPYLDTPYLILPAEQYQLTEAYQKLIESEDYFPRVHVGWRQVIPPRVQPDRIFIHDKLNAPVEEYTLGDEATLELEQKEQFIIPPSLDLIDEVISEEIISEEAIPEHTLSGIISLGLGRYIHVEADLLLYKPQVENKAEDEPAPPFMLQQEPMPFIFDGLEIELMAGIEEEQQPELFRIQGSLRLPSKEVHYLDHPLVGMLILFTPYELPEPEASEEIEEIISDNLPANNNSSKGNIGFEKEDRSF